MTDVERIAVLEIEVEMLKESLEKISTKLDALLELKTKGMGALGLVSLILGSGVIGIIVMAVNFFKGGGSHLG